MSDAMNSVHNLKIEIEIEQILLQNLERKKKRLVDRLAPAGYNRGHSYIDADGISSGSTIGFSDALVEINNIDQEIEKTEKNIKHIQKDIHKIECFISSLSDLEQKVKYMQLVEGKSLKEIADELGYNYDYIRRIASKYVR